MCDWAEVGLLEGTQNINALPFYKFIKQLVDQECLLTHLRCQIFLLFGNFDPSQWQKTLSDSRSAYSALKQHFLRSSEQPNEAESVVDPLDDDQNVRSLQHRFTIS